MYSPGWKRVAMDLLISSRMENLRRLFSLTSITRAVTRSPTAKMPLSEVSCLMRVTWLRCMAPLPSYMSSSTVAKASEG